MSEENVEVVRRYSKAAEEGTIGDAVLEAVVNEFWEPDGDYYPIRGFPEARPCHGREEIMRFFTEFYAAWDDYRYLVKDAWAIGDDRAIAHAAIHAEGRASGVVTEGDTYHCYWLRHGRFIRVEDHLTEKGALRALGLSGDTLEAAGLSE